VRFLQQCGWGYILQGYDIVSLLVPNISQRLWCHHLHGPVLDQGFTHDNPHTSLTAPLTLLSQPWTGQTTLRYLPLPVLAGIFLEALDPSRWRHNDPLKCCAPIIQWCPRKTEYSKKYNFRYKAEFWEKDAEPYGLKVSEAQYTWCVSIIYQDMKIGIPLQHAILIQQKSEYLCKLPLSYVRVDSSKLGYVVAQLVKALRYKPEGRRFDSDWSHWNFSVTILPVTLWPWDRLNL
jgi:hypothetical protein